MALIQTPKRLAAFADLYRRLAQLTVSGVPLILALKNIQQHPPSADFRAPLERTLSGLADGSTFSQSIQLNGGWLPQFDIALIEAGEQSGRLDKSMNLLAMFYDERARNARQMISDLAYPVALMHFAIFVLPFPELFLTGNVVGYLLKTVGVLVPVYALLLLFLIASQGQHGEKWRAMMEELLHHIPMLGSARRNLALARLTAALQALLSAGVNIFNAWEMAANASGSPALRKAVTSWRPSLESGETPGDILSRDGTFPELFSSHYRTGEMSGSLDSSLGHLHTIYFDMGTQQARALARWVPRCIYFVVMLVVAWTVLHMWMGIFEQTQRVLDE